MNLEQMKIHMTDIVQEVSLKYKGGESYFNEIDERIKKDIYFLSFYFKYVYNQTHNPIILSGEIGEKIIKFQYLKIIPLVPILVVNGKLRKNNNITYIKFYPIDYSFSDKTQFTMFDDSYYSGKTVNKVRKELNNIGCVLKNIYVFYDGSIVNKDNVKSLYRYYK